MSDAPSMLVLGPNLRGDFCLSVLIARCCWELELFLLAPPLLVSLGVVRNRDPEVFPCRSYSRVVVTGGLLIAWDREFYPHSRFASSSFS